MYNDDGGTVDVQYGCNSSFDPSAREQTRKSRKMAQPIRGQGVHLGFPIGLKDTTSEEDIAILHPVKCRFSGFREEVGNVSANQRPGRPSWSFDRPEKHKLEK